MTFPEQASRPRWCCGWELCLALAACGMIGGCTPRGSQPAGPKTPTTKVAQQVNLEALRPQVAAFCGDCHAVPPASSFPKEDWNKEVERGFQFYWDSGRTDLVEPVVKDVVAFYESQAPAKLEFPPASNAKQDLPVRFRRQDLMLPGDRSEAGVSSIRWLPPAAAQPGQLLLTDMAQGDVASIRLGSALGALTLGTLDHPASVNAADLDGDGRTDYVAADLGSFPPEDHDRGRVVWLRPDGIRGWQSHVLLAKVGRVADVVAGDFDGDGDSDVLVAEFGWRQTGKIHLLRRSGDEQGVPKFEDEILDKRHGVSHLRPIDWDSDGDLDFVALITQEHERVELFLNDSAGQFRQETMYAAGDPAFGSSGIELCDLDADGDVDVLFTNGDLMDSLTPKPYHGVRWLENRGTFPFQEHLVTTMPGVYKAVAADFDGDGDLDIVGVAFSGSGMTSGSQRPAHTPVFDLMVYLEQKQPGEFVRYRMEAPSEGLALAAGDFDNDGDADLASGSFRRGTNQAWLTIWWNERGSEAAPSAGAP